VVVGRSLSSPPHAVTLADRRAAGPQPTLFQRRGLWAVFFSRFLSPLRATLPLVSGASGLPLWSFQLANVSSGLLWPFLLLSPAL
jgi:membrane protein DedA with SNARE-associated domain